MNSAMGGVCLSTGNFRIRSLPMLHRKLKGVPLGRALPQFNHVVAAQLIAVLPDDSLTVGRFLKLHDLFVAAGAQVLRPNSTGISTCPIPLKA